MLFVYGEQAVFSAPAFSQPVRLVILSGKKRLWVPLLAELAVRELLAVCPLSSLLFSPVYQEAVFI